MCFFIIFCLLFVCFDFLCCYFFCILFLGCVCFLCVDIFFIYILNFNLNQQNNITMTFQDASCPPLAVSVEPLSQSLAVSVTLSLDVTVMTRRSTWSSVGTL